jgi:hypothetical protein
VARGVKGGIHRTLTVIDQMVERLAEDGDAEWGHGREVACREPARLVNLREEHLPGRPFEGPPLLDPPLQAAELDIGEPARKSPLEVVEEGLGLEPGIEPELVDEFGPNVAKRVLPGPPVPGTSPLTGKPVGVAVLASRLLVDAGLVRGPGQSGFGLEQLPQPPELTISKHPVLRSQESRKGTAYRGQGPGNLIVVDWEI